MIRRVDSKPINFEDVKKLYSLPTYEIKKLTTREKMYWFKHKIDSVTVPFTEGYNELIVARDSIVQDSLI